jgi:heme exporter protein D
MFDLGNYASFIIASYAVVGGIVAMMFFWVIADERKQKRRLADLEAQGISRRSDGNDRK